MIRLIAGQKTKRIYRELISKHLPSDMENWTYVEPFGGTFAINSFLKTKPKLSIYNDINQYDFVDTIVADEKHFMSFEDIIDLYDSENTVFYCDPPYFKKEYLYKLDMFAHQQLMEKLSTIKGRFVLSYEKCDYITKLYKNFNINQYAGDYLILRNEMVITNE